MDVKDLKALFDIISETDITEFEMENSEEKIVIRRGVKSGQLATSAAPCIPQATTYAPVETPAQTVTSVDNEMQGTPISSPIVGTFYSAPEPGAAPYVEVGHVVEKGQMLCIVEAMKLMNEIEAEFRCKILKVCKENGQAVEYGDSLFIVEKL
ncbi:MAG: acetyl-CoA carboxylase biotin carboxyl carrier protein [Desulfuromonadales bacterium]|nr:acetyl-CoA carboxylase biotin carboxyl carrier protein [Desulfuromonadales bacterium]